MRGKALPGIFFPGDRPGSAAGAAEQKLIERVAQGRTQKIQDQIVNVAGACKKQDLGNFCQGGTEGGNEEGQAYVPQPGKDQGQKGAQGKEQQYISGQVINRQPGEHRPYRMDQQPQIQADGVEGAQVQIPGDLIPVGDSGYVAVPVEQYPGQPGKIQGELRYEYRRHAARQCRTAQRFCHRPDPLR